VPDLDPPFKINNAWRPHVQFLILIRLWSLHHKISEGAFVQLFNVLRICGIWRAPTAAAETRPSTIDRALGTSNYSAIPMTKYVCCNACHNITTLDNSVTTTSTTVACTTAATLPQPQHRSSAPVLDVDTKGDINSTVSDSAFAIGRRVHVTMRTVRKGKQCEHKPWPNALPTPHERKKIAAREMRDPRAQCGNELMVSSNILYQKRLVPRLTYPFASIIAQIRQMLQTEGMYEALQYPTQRMRPPEGTLADWCDGAFYTNPTPSWKSFWEDKNGITLSMNIDWHQRGKSGRTPYSMGVIYVSVMSLDRNIR
jgi:hypothetical protein